MKSFAYFWITLVSLYVGGQQPSTPYDLLIQGGKVVDPKNNLNEVMDVAVKNGKIIKVARQLNPQQARQVVNATGLLVCPGLIDLHGHVFYGTQDDHYLSDGFSALPPDGFTFRSGVTTIVDCGGAGWKNFPVFKKNVIDNSKTRVLSFLNIAADGMRGGNYEQDVTLMDPKMAANTAKQYKDYIVGFKLAH